MRHISGAARQVAAWAVLCGCWACPGGGRGLGAAAHPEGQRSLAAPAAGGCALAQWLADGGASGAGCGAGGVAGAPRRVAGARCVFLGGRPACRACAAGPTRARTLERCRGCRMAVAPVPAGACGAPAFPTLPMPCRWWPSCCMAASPKSCRCAGRDDPAAAAWAGPAAARAGQPGKGLVALAVLLSALLFAVGHLPAAQAMAGGVDHAGGRVCPGGQYGLWLGGGKGWFWRATAWEAAIIAHVLAHRPASPLLLRGRVRVFW